MKKMLVLVLAGALGISLLAGCGGTKTDSGSKSNESSESTKEPESTGAEENTDVAEGTESTDKLFRVGFVNQANSDPNCFSVQERFIEMVQSDEFKEKVGSPQNVEVLSADSDLDIEKQTSNVETLLAKGVDMMFIIGVDTEGNNVSVQACNDAGVPVFMPFTESSKGEFAFIGWDELQLGEMQGKWCVENLPENAKICYLQGTPGREASDKREKGFLDTIAERGDITVLSKQPGNFNAADGMQVTEDWIQAYGDEMTCIVAADSQMISGAIEALKAAKLTDKVMTGGVIHLGTWDAETIKSGEQTFAVYAGMMTAGELSAEVAAKQYNGETIEHVNYIDLFNVSQDNYSEYFK